MYIRQTYGSWRWFGWLMLSFVLPLTLVDCQPATSQEAGAQEPVERAGAVERSVESAGPESHIEPLVESSRELCCDAASEAVSEPVPDMSAVADASLADSLLVSEDMAPEILPETWSSLRYVGLTYHRSDGNRWVSGKGDIPKTKPVDVTLTGIPSWLVATPWRAGSLWVVALSDGRVEAFYLRGRQLQPVTLNVSQVAAGTPPALLVEGSRAILLTGPSQRASTLTHPIPLAGDQLAFIETNGDLVLYAAGKETSRLSVKALPDARILVDEQQRLLLLTDPTTRYAHGVLGDALEAASITLLATQPSLRVLQKIAIPGQRVVEGIAPIWADLDGDGKREIIVTISDAAQGAQLVVYDEAGQSVATSPAIGTGSRWRNQMAVAPFGPGGALEVVDVFTPHIGGPTEFFRLQAGALTWVAQAAGYTSHVYGSRNLDMGLAGDFDGDGTPEIALPTQNLTNIGLLQRDASGVRLVTSLSLDGQLQTNLAAADVPGQGLLLGVGAQGRLRIWGAK